MAAATNNADSSGTSLTLTIAPPVARYTDLVVQLALHGSSSWTTVPHSGASIDMIQPVTGLTPNQAYDVRVATVNEQGQSSWSPIATATPDRHLYRHRLSNPGQRYLFGGI